MDKNRPHTFDQAIHQINEAMVAHGASLKDLLQTDYSNIRTVAEDLAPKVAQQLKDTAAPFVDVMREVAGPQFDFAVSGGKTLADGFDRQLKQNPYLVLGGVALGAMALGYLIGRSKTPSPTDFTGLTYGDGTELA